MKRLQAVAAAAVLCVGLASPAMAADAPRLASSPPTSPTAAQPHCVLTVRPVGETGPAVPVRCYATFAAAVASATSNAVQLPPGASTLEQEDLDASASNMRVSGAVIGIEYEDTSFRGWSMTISGTSQVGCRNGGAFLVGALPKGRNDEISSARTYNGCKSRHYSESNFTGATHLCGCASMSGMNDRTSSIRFSASG